MSDCLWMCRFVPGAFDRCDATWAGAGVWLHKGSQVCSEIQVSEQKQPGDIFLTAYSEHPIIVFINLSLNKTMGGL